MEPVEPEAEHVDEALDVSEDARRLAVAMRQLSAEHQAVLSMFAVEGLAHREIAEILGVPEGTVWSRLHAARKKLAAALGRGTGV